MSRAAFKIPGQRCGPATRTAKPEPTPEVLYAQAVRATTRALNLLRAAEAGQDVGRQVRCRLLSTTLGRYLATVMEEHARAPDPGRPDGADAASFLEMGGRA